MSSNVSVVLPYYERERALKRFLNSYKRMFTSEHFREVVIVDDGSERQHATARDD